MLAFLSLLKCVVLTKCRSSSTPPPPLPLPLPSPYSTIPPTLPFPPPHSPQQLTLIRMTGYIVSGKNNGEYKYGGIAEKPPNLTHHN